MKITVIGTGYVGLIAGLAFADFGNDVVGLDIDKEKVTMLNRGICPIYEVGADELLRVNLANERIRFTTDASEAIRWGDVIFIGVGTPQAEDGHADLTAVFESAHEIGRYMDRYKVVVDKSTVPVGTARKVENIISEELKRRSINIAYDIVSNPEFLREGKAVGDFLNPDRIVLGVESETAEKIMRRLYAVFRASHKPMIVTNLETAEMIKYATNAFLATKITFINEMANLCEKVGANILDVSNALGKDGRISPKFLHAGPGYGGSCFPKDTMAIASIGREYGAPVTLVEAVIKANNAQKEIAAKKIQRCFPQGNVTVAVLGVSFKPGTDDVRESPSLSMILYLQMLNKGYKFKIYDPQAIRNAKKILGDRVEFEWKDSVYDACQGVDAVVIATEWNEFRLLDFNRLKDILKQNILFDFRNIYNKSEMQALGFEYYGIGV